MGLVFVQDIVLTWNYEKFWFRQVNWIKNLRSSASILQDQY